MPIIKNKLIKKSSPLTFYVFHLPILLLILGIFTLATFISSKTTQKALATLSDKQALSYVLGDDSEDEEDSKDEDEDEDENEDEDSNEDQEDDDNDSDNENETDDDGEENEFENQNTNKNKSQTRTQNSDGTYSITKTETEGDKVKIESKTYDASGKLIKEEKHEGSDEGFESETEDSAGNKLKVRVQNTEALIKREGTTGLNNFPLFINESDNSVYVQTPNGEVKLGVMPQAILEKAELSEDIDSIEEVELESESEDSLEFKLKTKKTEKLFGVVKLEIPATVFYDAQSGEYLRSEQAVIDKILDFLSF